MDKATVKRVVRLALARRATLIKRLHQAQVQRDDRKCDQIYMRLQNENTIIEDCERMLRAAA